MTFVRLFDNPNVTQEQYDQSSQAIGVTSENVPDGGILHVAGPGPNGGWRVVEIWESEDAARKFDEEEVEPVLQQAGIQRPAPEKWEVHRLIVRGG
jgi:hypothetical protein